MGKTDIRCLFYVFSVGGNYCLTSLADERDAHSKSIDHPHCPAQYSLKYQEVYDIF